MKLTRFAWMAALALTATPTEASTLDFESLSTSSVFEIIGPSYAEDGFRLTESYNAGLGNGFYFWGSSYSPGYTGSTSLFAGTSGAMITLTRDDGRDFALRSIVLASVDRVIPDGQSTDVTFHGFKSDGDRVRQTFSIADRAFPIDRYTFAFDAAFSGLTSVTWFQMDYFHQFDDIVVEPVPEPASTLLSGLALAAIIARRRRLAPGR